MFETTVVESRRRRGGGRKLLTLPVSLAAHSVAIGAAVFASVWSVDFPVNPPSQLVQYAVVAPPPPPPPPAPRKAPAAKVETPEIPKNVQEMAPTAVPETITDSAGVEGGIEGGVEGGEEAGVMGGVVGGMPLQEPSPPEEGPLRVGGDVKPPVIVERVDPDYPQIARQSRVTGIVVVEAIIDKQGRVKNVRVLQGQPMGLSDAAVRAIEQWRFRPGTRRGEPVEVIFVLTVKFTLRDS
jgi:protein TonB